MTSKLKCPVCSWCNQPMVLQDDIFVCANTDCSACAESFLHKALTQAKQDLETISAKYAQFQKSAEIARKALMGIFFICELDASKDANARISEVYAIAKKVLEHKEQI